MNQFVITPSQCTITYACQVIAGPNEQLCEIPGAKFDTTTGDYTLATDDCITMKPGNHTIAITGSLESGDSYEAQFNLMLVNPCKMECFSIVKTPSIENIEYVIGSEKLDIAFEDFIIEIGLGSCQVKWLYTATLENLHSLPEEYITFD